MQSAALIGILLLTACGTTASNAPVWPIAGPEVAEELEKLPENEYPALWEWLGRIAKYKEKLDI